MSVPDSTDRISLTGFNEWILVEKMFKEREERYRTLFEDSPDGIVILKPDGIILDINRTAVKIIGNRKENLVGKSFYDITVFNKTVKSKLMELHSKSFSGGLTDAVEIYIESSEGSRFLEIRSALLKRNSEFLGLQLTIRDVTDRREAEEMLKTSEATYRTLLQHLPQKIFYKDRNSVYIACNENYARDLGITPKEIVGKNDFLFYPKDLAEKYRSDDKRIMDTEKNEEIEERYIQDGQEKIVHTVKTPVRNDYKDVIGVLGIFWDITEQKMAEDALKKSEEMLRNFMDSATDAFTIFDSKLNFININEVGLRFFPPGTTKDDLIGKNILDWMPTLKSNGRYDKYLEVIRTGKPFSLDDAVMDPTFGSRHINVRAFRMGNGLGLVASDITERKKGEEALRESETKWRSLVQNIPDIVMTVDCDGKLLFINHTVPGITNEQAVGMSVYDFIPLEHKDIMREGLKRAFQQKESYSYEISGVGPEGSTSWYSTRISPLKKDGKIAAAILITTDITKRKLTEDKLRDTVNDMERFNRLAVGRELQMIELKREVNDLLFSIGRPGKYKIHVSEDCQANIGDHK